MSILKSLNTGAAGLAAHGEAISVVGDNIANVNTVGFKKARAMFQDELNQSSGADRTAGSGSSIGNIDHVWNQGVLLTTDSETDLAISGDGFFVVEGNTGGVDRRSYTRAGQFEMSPDGTLVSSNGLKLQGYTADAAGVVGTTLGDLTLGGLSLPALPTTEIDMGVNLDSNEVVPATFDPTNPGGTSNFSTAVTTYDSLGNPHEISVYFRKTAANSWDWHGLVDGGELNGGTAGVPTQGANGSLTFTTNGALDTETTAASSWDFVGATAAQVIAFDFGDSITTDAGTGLEGTTQFGNSSTTNAISQDGASAGTVSGISIASDGSIEGAFSNGERRLLGQIATATFSSVDGLERLGNGLWSDTQASGEPLIAAPATGGRGSIVSGALEQANVDLGGEFVDLIGFQRGFQANTRIIQTADQLYSELVNLIR